MRRFAFGFAAAVLWASGAHAQTAGPAPDASRLRCRVDTLEVYLVRGDRQHTGTIVDECRVVQRGEARVLQRIHRTDDQNLGARTDTIVDYFDGVAVVFWIAKDSRRLLKESLRPAPGVAIEFVAVTPP